MPLTPLAAAGLLTPAELLAGFLVAAALLGAGAAAMVRIVPAGHVGVVTRLGRVSRTRPTGPAMVCPVVERVAMVSSGATQVAPIVARARTADDVPIALVGSAVVRVRDAGRWVAGDGGSRLGPLWEEAFALAVGEVGLFDLTGSRRSGACALARDRAATDLAELGADAVAASIESVEVELTADLLRWGSRHERSARASRR